MKIVTDLGVRNLLDGSVQWLLAKLAAYRGAVSGLILRARLVGTTTASDAYTGLAILRALGSITLTGAHPRIVGLSGEDVALLNLMSHDYAAIPEDVAVSTPFSLTAVIWIPFADAGLPDAEECSVPCGLWRNASLSLRFDLDGLGAVCTSATCTLSAVIADVTAVRIPAQVHWERINTDLDATLPGGYYRALAMLPRTAGASWSGADDVTSISVIGRDGTLLDNLAPDDLWQAFAADMLAGHAPNPTLVFPETDLSTLYWTTGYASVPFLPLIWASGAPSPLGRLPAGYPALTLACNGSASPSYILRRYTPGLEAARQVAGFDADAFRLAVKLRDPGRGKIHPLAPVEITSVRPSLAGDLSVQATMAAAKK